MHATRPQQAARLALATVLAGLGAWTLRGFLPALAWATVLAIALWPLAERVQRRRPGRHGVLPALLVTGAVALLVIIPLALVLAQLAREAGSLAHWLLAAQSDGIAVPDWLAGLPLLGAPAAAWWQANLADPQAAAELLGRLDRGWLLGLSRQLGALLLHRAVLFGVTLMALFALVQAAPQLTRQLLVASQRAFGPHGEQVGRQMVASVRGTVNGLVLVGLGEGALLGVAYALAGVPHPALLGLLTGIAAMIPFGAPLLFGLAALLLVVQQAVTAAAVVFGFGLVVGFIADHAIRPALIGGATRLPFLWVLLGILGGVESWGLLGLFLGPAIMAALILLWRDWTGTPDGGARATLPAAGAAAGRVSP